MAASKKATEEEVARFADMFSALGTEPRLRIMRLLLSAHPDGMVGDIITELGATASTLSHHLEKLKTEGLVKVQRERTFLRYSANADALRELLGFLYTECCTGNAAASFAHCQNFSVARLSRPLRAAMPTEMGFGSGVRRKSLTRFPRL
jgi:ArsR family transcriptional regulator, arsenate/arsenite/antimonite-responsive transcriptional repressor